jgi:preprotein translocase subunit SecD
MPAGAPPRRNLIISLIIVLVVAFGSLAATLTAGWSPRLGLDLAGGLSVVYQPATKTTQSDIDIAAQIIQDRISGLGVSGAQVNTQGNTVVVSVPGVTDGQTILNEIGSTGQLYFRPVECEALTNGDAADLKPLKKGQVLPACTAASLLSPQNLDVVPDDNVANGYTSANVPVDTAFVDIASTTALNDNPADTVLLPVLGEPGVRYVLGPEELKGTIVGSAQATTNQVGGWVVTYSFAGDGGNEWDAMAQTYFHAQIAIDLDGVIQSAPLIEPTQTSFTPFVGASAGTPEISGSFTESSAQTLALAMQYGALPVRLVELNTDTISPTLGHSSLVAGLGAGLVGLGLVLLYAILYYRALGLVIVLGLGTTAALLWAIISALGHTQVAPSFDLSGVTGLIVSIGITVDSYIVYFERLKDETRAGRTVRTSVDRGFKSAWKTVLAADFVSLLAAVLLYFIAVDTVKGFAFFLGLSTLMDVCITWYFTRPLVMLLGRRTGASTTSKLSMAAGVGALGASAHE